MKNQVYKVSIFLIIIFLGISNSNAQIATELHLPDSGFIQILNTNDGSSFVGKITAIESEEIEFTTGVGKLRIKIMNINSIKDIPATDIKDGEYWFPDPNSSRLYFAPKGNMLKKGEGYFQDIWLFFVGASYGFTDNFTIGVGTFVIPEADFWYFTPKFGIMSTENFHLAAGALIIKIKDVDAGIIYGVGTYGSADANFTLGLGYGYAEGDLAEKPMVTFGFEKRMSRRTAFISENWIFPGIDEPLISYGVRFFSESIAVDLAFFNTLKDFDFPGFPYVDFVYNF